MTFYILTLLILNSAGLTILGRTGNDKTLAYVFKPLTTMPTLAVCLAPGGRCFEGHTLLIAAEWNGIYIVWLRYE